MVTTFGTDADRSITGFLMPAQTNLSRPATLNHERHAGLVTQSNALCHVSSDKNHAVCTMLCSRSPPEQRASSYIATVCEYALARRVYYYVHLRSSNTRLLQNALPTAITVDKTLIGTAYSPRLYTVSFLCAWKCPLACADPAFVSLVRLVVSTRNQLVPSPARLPASSPVWPHTHVKCRLKAAFSVAQADHRLPCSDVAQPDTSSGKLTAGCGTAM